MNHIMVYVAVSLFVSLFCNFIVAPLLIQYYRNKWRSELDYKAVDRTGKRNGL